MVRHELCPSSSTPCLQHSHHRAYYRPHPDHPAPQNVGAPHTRPSRGVVRSPLLLYYTLNTTYSRRSSPGSPLDARSPRRTPRPPAGQCAPPLLNISSDEHCTLPLLRSRARGAGLTSRGRPSGRRGGRRGSGRRRARGSRRGRARAARAPPRGRAGGA